MANDPLPDSRWFKKVPGKPEKLFPKRMRTSPNITISQKMLANISWQTTQKSARNGQLLQRRRGIFAIANGNDADRLVSLLANRTMESWCHYPLVRLSLRTRKSPFWRGKSSIDGSCSIAMLNYQRVIIPKWPNYSALWVVVIYSERWLWCWGLDDL